MRGGRKRRGKKQGRGGSGGMETDAEKNPKGMENAAKGVHGAREENAASKRRRGESKGPEREQGERYDLPYTRSAAEIPIKEIRNGSSIPQMGGTSKSLKYSPLTSSIEVPANSGISFIPTWGI